MFVDRDQDVVRPRARVFSAKRTKPEASSATATATAPAAAAAIVPFGERRRRRLAPFWEAPPPPPNTAFRESLMAPVAPSLHHAPPPTLEGGQLENPTGKLCLLTALYAVQGVPFALIIGTLPTLFATSVSDARIGVLSLGAWPFALKALFAPLVDSYFSRKAWVIPCTLASGALWLWLGHTIEALVLSRDTTSLAAALFAVVLLLAAQDVAVDIWALELLPARSRPYAPVCQTVGMGAGNLIAHPLLLLLSSSRLRDPPVLTLPRFLWLLGPIHAALALAAALQPEPERTRPRPSLRRTLESLRAVAATPTTRRIGAACLLQRVGVAALDGCSLTQYMRLPGARQEHIACLAALQAPVALAAAVYAGRLVARSDRPAPEAARGQMRTGYLLLVASSVAVPALLCTHRVGSAGSTAGLVVATSVFLIANKLWWTAQGTLFNEAVVSPEGGPPRAAAASHLTLLNSLSNAGKMWPVPVALAVSDAVGYRAASGTCALAGLAALPLMWRLIEQRRRSAEHQRTVEMGVEERAPLNPL